MYDECTTGTSLKNKFMLILAVFFRNFHKIVVCLLGANHASIFYSQKVPIFIYNIFSSHAKSRKTPEIIENTAGTPQMGEFGSFGPPPLYNCHDCACCHTIK